MAILEELQTKTREFLGEPSDDILYKFVRSAADYPSEEEEMTFFRGFYDVGRTFDVSVCNDGNLYKLCPNLWIGGLEVYRSNTLRALSDKFSLGCGDCIVVFRTNGDPSVKTLIKSAADNVFVIGENIMEEFCDWLLVADYINIETEEILVKRITLDERFNVVQ